MGRNLFSIGGLYFGPGDRKGAGATWGISSDAPDRLQCMALGAFAINTCIPLRDIAAIDAYDIKGKGKATCIRLTLRNGSTFCMDLKKEQKVVLAVSQLTPLWQYANRPV